MVVQMFHVKHRGRYCAEPNRGKASHMKEAHRRSMPSQRLRERRSASKTC